MKTHKVLDVIAMHMYEEDGEIIAFEGSLEACETWVNGAKGYVIHPIEPMITPQER